MTENKIDIKHSHMHSVWVRVTDREGNNAGKSWLCLLW